MRIWVLKSIKCFNLMRQSTTLQRTLRASRRYLKRGLAVETWNDERSDKSNDDGTSETILDTKKDPLAHLEQYMDAQSGFFARRGRTTIPSIEAPETTHDWERNLPRASTPDKDWAQPLYGRGTVCR